MPYAQRSFAVVLVLFTVACTRYRVVTQTAPQVVWCDSSAHKGKGSEESIQYVIRDLTASQVRELRKQLDSSQWRAALTTYYSCYRQDYPHWIVYVNSSGKVTQTILFGDGTDSASHVLKEAHYVWLLLFTARPFELDSNGPAVPKPDAPAVTTTTVTTTTSSNPTTTETKTTTAPVTGPAPGKATGAGKDKQSPGDTIDLRFGRRMTAFHRDPIISTLIKGLSKLVGNVDPGSDQALADSLLAVKLTQIGDSLYIGGTRFGLVPNAEAELSMTPIRGKLFPNGDSARIGSIYSTLANAKERDFDIGIVTAATWGPRIATYKDKDTIVVSVSSHMAANAYLAAMWNIKYFRPPLTKRSWQRSSVGAFIATNVARGNLGDELVAGATFGRLVGNAGLTVGSAWAPTPSVVDHRVVTRLVARLLVGFDLRF